MEAGNPELVNKIKSTWKRKCEKYDKPCHLVESDIYKDGSPSNVLLFRGEPYLYETPGTSPIVRNKILYTQFCGQSCTFNSLYNWMQSILDPLYFLASCLGNVKQGVGATYILDERKWISYYTFDAKINLDYEKNGYYQSERYKNYLQWCTSKKQVKKFNAIKVLATGHFLASVFTIVKSGVKIFSEDETYDSGERQTSHYIPYDSYDRNSVPLDPMVSLSIDPTIAFRFQPKSDDNSETTNLGRLIILSVPKKLYPKQSVCTTWVKTPGELMDVNGCMTENSSDDFSDEQEIDANFILPKNLIKDVILMPEQ